MREDATSGSLSDGTYRIYNVTFGDERITYVAAGRFRISDGALALRDDPTGLLTRHVGSGAMTEVRAARLASIIGGSYRTVLREQPGVAYLPSYAHAL